MDLGRHLNYLRSTPEVRNNTLKVEINDMGQIAMRPIVGDTTRTFTSFPEARNYVRNVLGLTGAHVHTPGEQFSGARFMRQFAADVQTAHPGAEVIAPMTFNLDDVSSARELKKIYMPEGTPLGWLNIDDNKATLVQVRDPRSGNLWEAKDIFRFMEKTTGMRISGMAEGPEGLELPGKFGKRAKMFLHEKSYEMFMDEPLRVGIMDAAYNMDLDEFAKQETRRLSEQGLTGTELQNRVRARVREAADFASDGISEMSTGAFKKMLNSYKEYDKDIGRQIDDAIKRGADDQTLRRLHNERRLLNKTIGELEHTLEQGRGLFNARLAGGEVVELNLTSSNKVIQDIGLSDTQLSEVAKKLRKQGVYIKGNFSLNPELDDLGIDIRTHHQNVLDEVTLRPDLVSKDFLEKHGLSAKGRGGYLTLTPFEAMETRLDIQTASAYPEFYTRRLMEEGTEELIQQFQKTVDALTATDASQRRVPGSYMQILESMLDSQDPSTVRLAENVQAFIQSGRAISEDPYLMGRVLDTVAESLLVDKGGFTFPKITIPDAMRAEVVPYHTVKSQVEELKPGQVRFDAKGGQWVIHESDAITVKPAFGGYDFDDALSGMVRYERGAGGQIGQVKAIMIRQPNARGEWALFDMALDDDAVLGVIGDSKKQDAYKRLLKTQKKMQDELGELTKNIHRVRGVDLAQEADIMKRIGFLENSILAINTRVDEILSVSLRGVDEITTRDGQMPFRRGFEGGRFVGEEPFTLSEVDGVRRIRYRGEPENLIYEMTAPGADPTNVLKKQLSKMTGEQQMDVFGGLMRRLSHNVSGDAGIVGIWSNSRMFYDHFLAWNEDAALKGHLAEHFPRILVEQEQVIDAFAQGVRQAGLGEGLSAGRIRGLSNELIKGVVKTAALGVSEGLDTRIDPTLLKVKAKNMRAVQQGLAEANEMITSAGGQAVSLEAPENLAAYGADRVSVLMAEGDPRATIDVLRQGADRIQDLHQEFRASIGYGEDVLGLDEIRTSKQATRDAKNLLKSIRNSEARMSISAVMEDVVPLLESQDRVDLLEGLLGRSVGEYNRALQDDFLAELSRLFEPQMIDEGTEARIAGDRAYRALLRTMQMIEDSPHKSYSVIGAALHRIGMTGDVLEWKDRYLGKVTDELINHRGVVDIMNEMGTMVRGAEMNQLLDEILRTTDMSADMLDMVTRGIDLASAEDPLHAPAHVRQALEGMEGARVLPQEGALRGPLDPAMLIQPRQKGALPETLGQMLHQFDRATHAGTKAKVARNVREALLGFQSVIEDWAADDDMPDRLRDYVIRSMERKPGTRPAEDVLRAERARDAARRATKAGENSQMARGFMSMFRELSATRGGRGIMAGVAGLGAIGIIDAVRKKDRTVNEMQGPAFLPGGNPYVDDPNAHGAGLDMEMVMSPPEYNPPSQMGGVTYQVRTRGGNYDDQFVNEVQNITGGNVTGTIYDDSAPFQSANVREEILRMYG